ESVYCGNSLAVFLLIDGRLRCQPRPKTPLPAPELYDKVSVGEVPLAAEKGRGIEQVAVPFTAFTANFSSIPLMAPPPLGKSILGADIAFDWVFPRSVLRNWLALGSLCSFICLRNWCCKLIFACPKLTHIYTVCNT